MLYYCLRVGVCSFVEGTGRSGRYMNSGSSSLSPFFFVCCGRGRRTAWPLAVRTFSRSKPPLTCRCSSGFYWPITESTNCICLHPPLPRGGCQRGCFSRVSFSFFSCLFAASAWVAACSRQTALREDRTGGLQPIASLSRIDLLIPYVADTIDFGRYFKPLLRICQVLPPRWGRLVITREGRVDTSLVLDIGAKFEYQSDTGIEKRYPICNPIFIESDRIGSDRIESDCVAKNPDANTMSDMRDGNTKYQGTGDGLFELLPKVIYLESFLSESFFSIFSTFFSRNFSIFHIFDIFLSKCVKFNELDFFALKNFTNSDRRPP